MQDVVDSLKKSWFLYLFIGSIIVTWTKFDSRIATLEATASIQREQISSLELRYNNVANDISAIKTSIEFIKVQLTK